MNAVLILRDLWRFTFVFFTTIIHEMGHALVALITGGGVLSITFNMTSSAETLSSYRNTFWGKVSSILSLLSGYPAPGVFASVLLVLLSNGSTFPAAVTVIVVCALCLIFSIRGHSFVGIFYTLLFGGLTATLVFFVQNNKFLYIWLTILIFSLLIGSISSLFELWKITIIYPNHDTDATFCKERIFSLPTWFWALFLTFLSALVVCIIFKCFSIDLNTVFSAFMEYVTEIFDDIVLKKGSRLN